nr:hypothetical protein [uncultured Draconibacterium sp.]
MTIQKFVIDDPKKELIGISYSDGEHHAHYIINDQSDLHILRAHNKKLIEACEAALVVGEIKFESCALSKSVKQKLLAAIANIGEE